MVIMQILGFILTYENSMKNIKLLIYILKIKSALCPQKLMDIARDLDLCKCTSTKEKDVKEIVTLVMLENDGRKPISEWIVPDKIVSDKCLQFIKGYEGLYQVSNLGRIKSLPKYNCKYEKILKLHTNKRDGRQSIMLCKDSSTRKRMLVHRLVAIAFIKNPLNLHEINHKDENP